MEMPEEIVQAEEACLIQVEGRLATSCVSCCNCTVKAARVVLMLFLEMFYLFVSLWRWCCRYPKTSAMPWGVSRAMTSGEWISQRVGYNRGG